VLVSPIFDTPGKVPRGVEALRTARAMRPDVSLFALGGINAANAMTCYRAGATGVAVMRALLDAADPAAVARALLVRSAG
jgi:thiamine-phosphate pyrophosphorylase